MYIYINDTVCIYNERTVLTNECHFIVSLSRRSQLHEEESINILLLFKYDILPVFRFYNISICGCFVCTVSSRSA